MKRKPIYEYRLNGNDATEDVIIHHASSFNLDSWWNEIYQVYDLPTIEEAIIIVRENGHTIEYLGV